MASSTPHWLALRGDLVSVSIDPLTRAEIGSNRLPAGTWIENPFAAIERALATGHRHVIVRAQCDEWLGLERVDVLQLRAALGIRTEPPPRPGAGPGTVNALRVELAF